MKWILLAGLIFNFNVLFSQEIVIQGVNASGLKDECIISFSSGSSLGIDSDEGELNLYNSSPKEFDLRIIQRDTATFDCAYSFSDKNNTEIHFPENLDLKKDVRPNSNGINGFFEIKNFTKNFTLIDICDFENKLIESIESIHIVNGNCDTLSAYSAFDFFKNVEELNCFGIIIEPNNFAYEATSILITVNEKTTSSIDSHGRLHSEFEIYPNPAKDYFSIPKSLNNILTSIEIYDFLGRKLKIFNDVSTNRFNVNELESSNLYNVVFYDKFNNVYTKLLLKS